ncbi:uncharacterized protein LOC128994946 isoform X2 [Macrosteles quadrilineatus]|nr:uncharacterized protein LOC128994946 isoform X2 [Macrosteles quadrilineatus]
MDDERWTVKDKIDQFRGVTTLFNNAYTNIKEKTQAQRKKLNKEIKILSAENQKYRQQYEEVLNGDKTSLLPVLHSHPKLQLAFKNLDPQGIEEELKQSIFCKNKELDRLRYKRKNLEDILLSKKLELGLEKNAEEAPENFLFEQEIANQIQSISVKLNAARTTHDVYERALKILEKDAIRFDEVLEGLRKDLLHQGESIVKAVEIGQSVSEELNGLQREYRITEREVRDNMRLRDRAIRELKAEIDNVRVYAYTSGRRETGDGGHVQSNMMDDNGQNNIHNILELTMRKELAEVEGCINQIKEAAMVHRAVDILPRLKEQKRQRKRLERQVAENKEELSRMLELHNQLDVMLEVVLYHTMTDDAKALKEERTKLYKAIEEVNDNMKGTQEDLVQLGQKILDVRTALLTLNIMLDTVWPSVGADDTIDYISAESEIVVDPNTQVKPLSQPNTEALTLMEQVTKKLKWLLSVVETLDKTDRKPAQRQKLSHKSSKVQIAEDDADNIVSDMLDELEDMDDPSVPTRRYIKAESQRIVDMYNDPRALFEVAPIKYKKHACF